MVQCLTDMAGSHAGVLLNKLNFIFNYDIRGGHARQVFFGGGRMQGAKHGYLAAYHPSQGRLGASFPVPETGRARCRAAGSRAFPAAEGARRCPGSGRMP